MTTTMYRIDYSEESEKFGVRERFGSRWVSGLVSETSSGHAPFDPTEGSRIIPRRRESSLSSTFWSVRLNQAVCHGRPASYPGFDSDSVLDTSFT